jgi:hypothetical protein
VPADDPGCPWFLANAFDFGTVDKAVPLASLVRPAAAFDIPMVRQLGYNFPDQEIVGAMCGRRVSAKDRWDRKTSMYATNHGSGLRAWRLVTKANDEYKRQGQLYGFPISVCPAVHPAVFSPTGAVPKKTRLGLIDPLNIRPTADYSWPPVGYWMEWLIPSVNDTIQLEEDFPWVRYIRHTDLVNQALALKALGEPVL